MSLNFPYKLKNKLYMEALVNSANSRFSTGNLTKDTEILFVGSTNHITCINTNDMSILWEKPFPHYTESFEKSVDGQKLYTFAKKEWLILNGPNGKTSNYFQVGEKEGRYSRLALTDEYLYMYSMTEKKIAVFNKETLELQWTFDENTSDINKVYVYKNIAILNCREHLYGLSAENGELLWTVDFREDWFKKAFAAEYQDYINNNNLSPSSKETPVLTFSNIDHEKGRIFINLGISVIACFDINTQEIIWSYQYEKNDITRTVSLLQQHNGKVSFLIEYYYTKDHLVCLDAESGHEICRTENFTPHGCSYGILHDKYFIGVGGNHLAAYDLEEQFYAWEYKNKHLAGGKLWLLEDGSLINYISETETLYKFGPK